MRGARLVAAALGVSCLALAGCGPEAAEGVVKVLGRNVGKVGEVAEHVPRGRLPGAVTVTREAVESEVVRLTAPVGRERETEAKQDLEAACRAKDLMEVESTDDAVSFAIQQTGTPAGRYETVRSLATELDEADSTQQQSSILAVAAICQWADTAG